MRSSRHLIASLALAAVVGCSSARQTSQLPPARINQQAISADPAVQEPADRPGATTADKPVPNSLADKMAAYSRDLEPKLKERQSRKAPPPTAKPAETAKADSEVQWAGEAKQPAPADPSPGAAAPMASNQVAVLTPKKSNDVPAIVPEGEDVPGQMGPGQAASQDSDQLLQQLAAKIRDNPKDLPSQLDYQLLQFVRGERVPHMASIASMSAEDREILTAVLDALSNFRSGTKLDQNQMLSRKIRPLVEMSDRLRAQADLSLPTAALCTRVDGFGVYEPITPARFAGAKDHPFIIYCEVENFASQVNDKKVWETKLSHEAVLYTETGLNVWSEKSDSIVDHSRNRRHDFFIVKKTKLPANLPIGRYVLKLSVTDQQSNRVAETTVPVQIVAQ